MDRRLPPYPPPFAPPSPPPPHPHPPTPQIPPSHAHPPTLPCSNITEEELSEIFQDLDDDGGGTIDIQEFKDHCYNIPRLAWKAEKIRYQREKTRSVEEAELAAAQAAAPPPVPLTPSGSKGTLMANMEVGRALSLSPFLPLPSSVPRPTPCPSPKGPPPHEGAGGGPVVRGDLRGDQAVLAHDGKGQDRDA